MSLITNLISYWKLDESSGNAADSVGGNTLANVNSATYSSAIINNGVNLVRASSQRLAITDAAQSGLDLTGDMTISGWVKFTSFPNQNNLIGKEDLTSAGYSFYYENTGNHLIFSTNSTASPKMVSWTPSTGVWYHVAIVYTASGGLCDFYVDGIQQGTQQSGLAAPTDSPSDFTMGYLVNGGSHINASMDEWGIWSRTLSGSEISQLYNSGSGLSYPFGIAINNSSFLTMF